MTLAEECTVSSCHPNVSPVVRSLYQQLTCPDISASSRFSQSHLLSILIYLLSSARPAGRADTFVDFLCGKAYHR